MVKIMWRTLYGTYVSSTIVPIRVASPVRITTARQPPSTTENTDIKKKD